MQGGSAGQSAPQQLAGGANALWVSAAPLQFPSGALTKHEPPLCLRLQKLGSNAQVFTWDTAAELKAIGDALEAVRNKGNTGLMNNVSG